jgi:hypothetical protein
MMSFKTREFVNRKTGKRFRVYSDAPDLPSLRKLVAKHQSDDDWLDPEIYEHDAGIDIMRPGTCELGVEEVE